jgi:uncharacterized protein YbbK (DUF523 family)
MRLVEHPEQIAALPEPTPKAPWRVLTSGCMIGWACAVDGTDMGLTAALPPLGRLPNVQLVPFCPEDVGIGTPRGMPDIHGGDGFAVLDGVARVLDEHNVDLTAEMIRGATAMVARARDADVHFALLLDMSGSCGSQVISDGCRLIEERRYRRGVGVAAAALIRAGVPIVSQRDYRTLGLLHARLDPAYLPDPAALDHHETPWVIENLPTDH